MDWGKEFSVETTLKNLLLGLKWGIYFTDWVKDFTLRTKVRNLLLGLKWGIYCGVWGEECAKETEVKNFFEGLRKTIKILNQHDCFPSQDFNLETPEYKARDLSTLLPYSALFFLFSFFLSFFLSFFFFLFLFVSSVFLSESQQVTLRRTT